MVCQQNLLFETYKFRDSGESEKVILFLNINTGLTITLQLFAIKVVLKIKSLNISFGVL